MTLLATTGSASARSWSTRLALNSERGEHGRQRQRPRQEERRLGVGGDVHGQPLEADPRQHACSRAPAAAGGRPARTPPRRAGRARTAAGSRRRPRCRARSAGAGSGRARAARRAGRGAQLAGPADAGCRRRARPAPPEPQRGGHGQARQEDQRVADRARPGDGRAVAGLGRAEQAMHERTVVAEEPPHLPRLEDRRPGAVATARVPATNPPDPTSTSGASTAAATTPALARHRSLRPGGRASSTGPTASSAHSLLAIASPRSTPAQIERPRPVDDPAASSTAATHRQAPSSSSGWPSSRARRVSGLATQTRQRQRAGERRASFGAHPREPARRRAPRRPAGRAARPCGRRPAARRPTARARARTAPARRASRRRRVRGAGSRARVRSRARRRPAAPRCRSRSRRSRTGRATPSSRSRRPPRTRTGRSRALLAA